MCYDDSDNPIIVIWGCPSSSDALRLSAKLIKRHYPDDDNHITGVELEPYASEELSSEAWKATIRSSKLPDPCTHSWQTDG